MAFINNSLNLNTATSYASLEYTNDGVLTISGANPNMIVNVVGKEIELNGAAIPSPADISNLTNEINQINANIQTAGVDVFSSPPIQVDIADGSVPPTTKAKLVLHHASYLNVMNADDTKGGGVGIDEFDNLEINAGNANAVNIISSAPALLYNGAPVSGGNVALDECFDTPISGTFSTPKPINISSINPNAAKLQMVSGGILSMASPDTSQFTNLSVDNSAVLNITGTIGEVSVDGNVGVKGGKQLKLYTGDGDYLNLQNTGSLGSNILDINSQRVNIAGNTYIKSGNNLYLNNLSNGAAAYMNCVDNSGSGGGINELIVNTAKMIVNGSIQANNSSLISKGSNPSQQILSNDTTQPKCVFGYNNLGTYVEMELLGNSTNQLQFYNSSGAGFNFLNGDVINDGNQLQPVNSGSSRPSSVGVGYMYFDTSLVPPKPVFYTGTGATNWVDATGVDA